MPRPEAAMRAALEERARAAAKAAGKGAVPEAEEDAPDVVVPQGRRMGTVRKWKENEGYGFIRPDDGGNDVFLHNSALAVGGMCRQTVQAGSRVEFKEVLNRRGHRHQNRTRAQEVFVVAGGPLQQALRLLRRAPRALGHISR